MGEQRRVKVGDQIVLNQSHYFVFADTKEMVDLPAETMLRETCETKLARFTKIDRAGKEIQGLLFPGVRHSTPLEELGRRVFEVMWLPRYYCRKEKTPEPEPVAADPPPLTRPVVLATPPETRKAPPRSQMELDALERKLLRRGGKSPVPDRRMN